MNRNKITLTSLKQYFLISMMSIFLSPFIGNSQTDITLGSGSGTTSYFPIYYLFNYSYSQTIYTNSELSAAGATGSQFIYKIRYKPTASVSTSDWRDWVVYLGNTSKNGFSGTSDWESVNSLTEVYNGQIQANVTANQWVEIVLAQPFLWDGTSNILVAVDQNTPSWGGSPSWAGYTGTVSSGSKGIYYYSDGTNPNPAGPPSASGTSNIVAQIQFEMMPAEECSGQPSAGTPIPTTFGNCPAAPFTFALSGTSVGQGVSYQWQVRPVGTTTWNNLFTTPTLNYPANAFNQDLEFRLYVTCENSGLSDTSDVVLVTLNDPIECYCTPGGTSSSNYINNFETSNGFTNISNLSSGYSSNGYGDFTDMVVTQFKGQSIDFTSSFQGGTFGARIWVDWNQNGTFENSEVVYATGSHTSSITGTITVPTSALTGNTRMRIGIHYLSTSGPEACEVTSNTEFEDYTFHIADESTCDGQPSTGTIVTDMPLVKCKNDGFSIAMENYTLAHGMTYQWQERTLPYGVWNDIPGADLPNLNYPPNKFKHDSEYRLIVTCDNSGLSDTSDVAVVTTKYEEGVDGSVDVCILDGVVDLYTAITTPYPNKGEWKYLSNPTLVNGSMFTVSSLSPGEHKAMYIVKNSCTADTTYATVNVFKASTSGEGGTIGVCLNQPVDLYSGLSGNVDVGGKWYQGSTLLPNSQPTLSSSGTYTYTYEATNGVCPAVTTDVIVIVDGSCDYSGLNEEFFANLSVYPNPASSHIMIVAPSNKEVLDITIVDMNGRAVLTQKAVINNTSEALLDISSLTSGIYSLRIYNEEGQYLQKLIKQ